MQVTSISDIHNYNRLSTGACLTIKVSYIIAANML
jgi:hypothetical protein